MQKMRILISSSGTGGHLLPAQQLAEKLKKKNCDIFFAAHDIDKRIFFQKDKFLYKNILSSNLRQNKFLGCLKILKGFFQSLKLLFQYKPNVVVGFGSYHSFPVILASVVLRKKIVLFDSNVVLGKVNRLFSKRSSVLALQFKIESKLKNIALVKRFPWNIKTNFAEGDNFEKFNLEKNVFTILVFGGSQGSQVINLNFLKVVKDLREQYKFQVVHILGKKSSVSRFKKIYEKNRIRAFVSNFERDISPFYLLADLIISRSGACSILEFIHFEKPSILIPYKKASDNHQLKNALFMQDKVKSSTILLEDEINKEHLLNEILEFLKNDKKKLCVFKENVQKFKCSEEEKNKKDLADLIIKIGNQ